MSDKKIDELNLSEIHLLNTGRADDKLKAKAAEIEKAKAAKFAKPDAKAGGAK